MSQAPVVFQNEYRTRSFWKATGRGFRNWMIDRGSATGLTQAGEVVLPRRRARGLPAAPQLAHHLVVVGLVFQARARGGKVRQRHAEYLRIERRERHGCA